MKDFKLDDHKKISPGFEIPDGYFDHLSEKINSRLKDAEPKTIPLYNRKKWFYAAASVLVFGLGITAYNALMVRSNTADATAIENYLAGQTATEDILVELLEKDDIEQLNNDYALDDKAVEDILSHNTNLEQYLIN